MNLYGKILLAVPVLALASTATLFSSQATAKTTAPASGTSWYSFARPLPAFQLADTISVQSKTYRVRRGQTLSSVAAKLFGKARDWPVLWWDNRDKLPNPNALRTGERLLYGSWDRVRPWLRHRANRAAPRPVVTNRSGAVPVAPAAPPAPAGNVPTGGMSAFETCVISRESGGNPQAYNPASGAGGLFQFLPSTWASLGFAGAYPGGAQTAPVAVQEEAFNKLYAEAGTSPWAPYDGC